MQRRIIIVVAMLMALAACGPAEVSGTISPDPVADPAADPQPDADPEPPNLDDETLEGAELVIYSGRSQSLIGPLLLEFEEETGIEVAVRWGQTAQVAATLLEEGQNSPADVFFAQDPGGLGALADRFMPLPQELLEKVDPRFRGDEGHWIGISGRARVLVYNTETLSESDLPEDLSGLTDPKWRGRLGWAPTNASLQTMVTAMRAQWGEQATRQWLEGILANEPEVYSSNTPVVAAVGSGEIELGLVNHYYLYRFLAEEGEAFPARNYFLPAGGPGSLVMTAGIGILETTDNKQAALRFVEFLLSQEAQHYFSEQTYEYPLAAGVPSQPDLTPLAELNSTPIDLSDLADLEGTLNLLRDVGALP